MLENIFLGTLVLTLGTAVIILMAFGIEAVIHLFT